MTEEDITKHYDLNSDGKVTDAEIEQVHKMDSFLNDDAKSDAQRKMAWFSLIGMLLYPVCVIVAVCFGLEVAATVLGAMAPTYFGSVAVIVAAFFGSQAYSKKTRI